MRSHRRLRQAQRGLSVVALALGLAGCHAPPARTPLAASANAPLRLGWITWSEPDEVIYCNRRLDDNGGQIGVLGPCWREPAGEPAKKILSWLNVGRPDESPPTAGPWERCAVERAGDASGARLVLRTPTKTEVIEDWHPDATVGGDVYALELSFSPEGKWMAVARLAIHLGEGERIVEIPSVDIRPVPACR